MLKPPRVSVFVHVATVGRYVQISHEIMRAIRDSGLSSVCSDTIIGVVGDGDVVKGMDWPPCSIRRLSRSLESYEFPTLELLQAMAMEDRDSLSLYLHVKGATALARDRAAASDDWRRYMLHFLVERYDECIASMKNHDLCGTDWRELPYPHFSGNFWWGANQYIASLPSIAKLSQPSKSPYLISRRHNCEFWVGMSKSPRIKCLFDSCVNVYRKIVHRFPRKWYEGRSGSLSWCRRMQLKVKNVLGPKLQLPPPSDLVIPEEFKLYMTNG